MESSKRWLETSIIMLAGLQPDLRKLVAMSFWYEISRYFHRRWPQRPEFDYILESLWKSALKLGRDPATAFSTVANMSEPEIRAILEKFGNSRGLESPTDGRDD